MKKGRHKVSPSCLGFRRSVSSSRNL
jgi:hypothetical protein